MNVNEVIRIMIFSLRKLTQYSIGIVSGFIFSSQAFAYLDTPADFGWTGYLSGLPSAEEACRSHLPTLVGPNGYFLFESVNYINIYGGTNNYGYCIMTEVITSPPPGSITPHYQIGGAYKVYSCKSPSYLVSYAGICRQDSPPPNTLNPPKNLGPGCTTTNPIKIGTGNKWLSESDLSSTERLGFTRYYNSQQIYTPLLVGRSWTHDYSMLIVSVPNDVWATIFRGNGKAYSFNLVGNIWTTNSDITDTLFEVKDINGTRIGWTYKVGSTGEVETYDVNGHIVNIANRNGLIKTLYYSDPTTPTSITSAPDLLIRVTDALGQQIKFTYDNSNRISTLTNPAGGVYTYTYSTDTNNNLSSVTYPDGKTKTYLYGEAANVSATPNAGVSYANALTGIIDENNNRYATYRYDAAGRAYDEELAQALGSTLGAPIEHNNLVYNVDASGNPVSTVVTDARGSARTYNFTTILGVVKSTGQSQPGGSGCSAAASALTYDANGNVSSRTDFDGHQTTYVYDLTRNLETSRTEGLTTAGAVTPATRTITTTWHPTWRLPLVTTTHTGGANAAGVPTGAALHKTTNVYDTKGNITSITENDPVRTLNRTTSITYTYSTVVPGLVLSKVVNGPRSDVTDTTTYTYYPHDATCVASAATPIVDPITGVAPANLGCRGQLSTMVNALGQTTTYNRYNHHGQVEQMTDANGLVTTNSYDLRQRLLSRTVSGAGLTAQVTSLTYDNAGQVTQLKLPDNSRLSYTYDAAHRLTDIQDTLGNKVHYTLDASGNRIKEDTKDPSGVLAKTLTRSYDALNRLQTVTGVE